MRLAVLFLVIPLLAGCTSWKRMHSFLYDEPPPVRRQASRPPAPPGVQAATPARAPRALPGAPAPALAPAAQDDEFCQAVSRQDAAQNGFDAATQARILARSYQQCVTIFGPR